MLPITDRTSYLKTDRRDFRVRIIPDAGSYGQLCIGPLRGKQYAATYKQLARLTSNPEQKGVISDDH